MRPDESGATCNDRVHASSLTGRASAAALRLDAQVGPLRADLVALDAYERVDYFGASEHAGAPHTVVTAQWRDATMPSMPLEVVSARTDEDSFERHGVTVLPISEPRVTN